MPADAGLAGAVVVVVVVMVTSGLPEGSISTMESGPGPGAKPGADAGPGLGPGAGIDPGAGIGGMPGSAVT